MERRDQFDHIVIETTGLADPKPIIETFVAYPVRSLLRASGIMSKERL